MVVLKKIYKACSPPILDNSLRLWLKKIRGKGGYFSGPYLTWRAATNHSKGYDDVNILNTVRQAALAQKQNNTFMRDGVKLDRPDYSHPLLTALLSLLINKSDESDVNVIDFGGGLGSTYYNCQKFISNEKFRMIWHIIEQSHFVKIGQEDHQTENLLFFDNIDQVAVNTNKSTDIDMMILSSVLQYLPNYLEVIKNIHAKNYPYIFIDRLSCHFQENQATSIMVEHVPTHIYQASYPLRIFNYHELLSVFLENYDIVYEFVANEGCQNLGNIKIVYRGILLKLKTK